MTDIKIDANKLERGLAAAFTVLLAAVMLTSHAVSGVMARYTTAGSSGDEARVALFGHDESIDLSTWAESMVPGDTRSFVLTVSNVRGENISEVAQSYDIEVQTAGNLPLKYSLERTTSDNKVAKDFDSFTESSDKKTNTFSDDGMTFSPGVARLDTYKLTVEWPANENSYTRADIPDFVQININVKQID